MANVPGHDEADDAMGADDPAPAAVDHVQRRLHDAGLLLLAVGCNVLTYATVGSRATNAEHALVGFALLLLGVFLVMLPPVAHRFPGAARFGTAVADAVVSYLLEVAPPGGN